MDRSVLGESSNPDVVSKPVGSSVKIDSISIDLVSNDETDAGKCEHFSIRGFVSEVRKKNWKLCWPFAFDGNHNIPEGESSILPPINVSKFKWWRCENCLYEMSSEGNNYSHGKNGPHYCTHTRFKSSGTCPRFSSLGDAATLQSDFEQAPKLSITAGKITDAGVATDLIVNCCLPSDDDKNGKESEPKNTPVIGCEIFPEDEMNQEIPGSAGATTAVTSGLMIGRHHPVENDKLLGIGKQPHSEEENLKLMTAYGTSRVVSMVDEVLDAANGLEHPYSELDDHDNASSDNDEALSENDLQDHQHEKTSGSHRRKNQKVRLLTELLAENGDVKANLARNESSPSNSVPDSSAKVDVLSDPLDPVAVQGNPIRLLDQNSERKFLHDEEHGPSEISSPNNFHKKNRNCTESSETTSKLASSDAKGDAGIDLQFGEKGHLNKFGFDRCPIGKKKTKSLLVDKFLPLALSGGNSPEDVQNRAGDAKSVCPANAVSIKSAQTAFSSWGMHHIPLLPQMTERNSSICNKGSKIPQFDEWQASLNPWSSGREREDPSRTNDVEIKQMYSTTSPFLSSQDGTSGKGLQLSMDSCVTTQGRDSKYISPLELWQFPWRGNSSKENAVMGKDTQTHYARNSDYPSKSETDVFRPKEAHCDLSRENCRLSFLNEKQKSTSEMDAESHSLMQLMDVHSRGNNRKSIEVQHSALALKPSNQQTEKVSEQGVPDDILMEIVELMAKNQYERCLPDVANERPQETNTINAPASVKGKLSFLSGETAQEPKTRAKNGRNGKITTPENGRSRKQKSVDCFPQIGRKHFNFYLPGQIYGSVGFMPFAHCQETTPSGIKFSDTSSCEHHSSHNCHFIGNIPGHRTSQSNLQTSGACNPGQCVPQQSKETAHLWSSMIPSHMAFVYDNPQKLENQSINADMLSRCPSLHKSNVNGNHNLNFLNLDVTNSEKHNRTFGSESLSRPRPEYPFACKHRKTGPLDVYSNETIPAMHLLSLMDAGLQSGAPMDIDGNSKFLERPSFPHDHHSKDFSGLSSGGYTTKIVKPSPYDCYGKNNLSENSCEYFPVIQTVGASGFSTQHDEVFKKTTRFTGQESLLSQGRDKAKTSHSPSQNKDNRSQQPVFITGGSGTSHGTIPVHNMQKMFIDNSNSLAFPSTFHGRENATKQKSESCNASGTVLPPKSSSKTETCSINRNPSDFSIPEPGNIYMIKGEDLKFRKAVFAEKRSGRIKRDGRKRQKKLNAVKGNI